MKHAVLITCWNRPEFLGACVRHLMACPGWQGHLYIFAIDRDGAQFGPRRSSPENTAIIDQFTEAGANVKVLRHRHNYHGNSYNVLEGYKYALTLGADLIHLIEEDIFVSPDYFLFAEEAHIADPDCMFVSACRNQNRFSGYGSKGYGGPKWTPEEMAAAVGFSGDVKSAVYIHRSYQSLAVSWKPDRLRAVVEHANDRYYKNMPNYLRMQFPESAKNGYHTEQDGLIYRVMESVGGYGIFPLFPRAYHAGWASPGYNRPGKLLSGTLPLTERVNRLMNMSEKDMNDLAGNPAYRDITKCAMEPSGRVKIQVITNAIHATH